MKNKLAGSDNLEPNDYYESPIFTIEDGKKLEIQSNEPIQVRINNGPWQNVRPLK